LFTFVFKRGTPKSRSSPSRPHTIIPFKILIMALPLTESERTAVKNRILGEIGMPDLHVLAICFNRSYECIRLIFHELLDSLDLTRAEYVVKSLKDNRRQKKKARRERKYQEALKEEERELAREVMREQ